MLRKIIAWMLLVTVTATVAVGGTLAYLTDRDSEANVFTEGDVTIDLTEDFKQGATLIPGVEIEKKPTIANTGKNDAWVWATVAVPGDLTDVVEFVNQNSTDWDWSTVTAEEVEINGAKYTLLTALHNEKLASGAETHALFEKVALDPAVDITPEGQWYKVEQGVPTDLNWNNSDGNPVIYVSAYAIQTEEFETVKEAYDAYMAQWGENGPEYADPGVLVSTAEELKEAMKAGGKVILNNNIILTKGIAPADGTILNLNGYTITDASTGGRTFGAQKGASFTIIGDGTIQKDASVTSGFAMPLYISNGTVVVEGGTFNMGTPSEKDYSILLQNGGKLIINDGKFTNTANYPLIYAIHASTVEINGGFFESLGATNPDLLDIEYHQSRISTITIKGGTFVNYNPLEDDEGQKLGNDNARVIVADGYKIVSETQDNGDVWYTVVPK